MSIDNIALIGTRGIEVTGISLDSQCHIGLVQGTVHCIYLLGQDCPFLRVKSRIGIPIR
jgi:hypothetical protein